MHIEYLKNFVETADLKSISKASEKLNITHPALSKQIRNLEDYFGVQLFFRSTNGVLLTAEGEDVYRITKRIIRDVENIKKEFSYRKSFKGDLVIGTLPSIVTHYLPYKLKNTDFNLKIKVFNNSYNLLKSFDNADFDVAIVDQLNEKKYKWNKVLFKEDFYVVLPKNHHLARKELVSIFEILMEPLVMYPENCRIRDFISKFLNQGNELKVEYEIEFGESLINYVVAGLGVTIVPELFVKRLSHLDLVSIKLKEPGLSREISMVTNSAHLGEYICSLL